MRNIASPYKIALHRDRLGAFLRGEPVHPVCIELDITTECTNKCRDCPSRQRPEAMRMPTEAVDRLLASLDGQTAGLLLSGGEPTMAENFPEVLKLARRRGVEDVAVVTNGARLKEPRVVRALLDDATAVRLSLYGWDGGPGTAARETLLRVESLRSQIDAAGSELEIGLSVLTATGMATQIPGIVKALGSAGAHWVYFHPLCQGWESGRLRQVGQDGITEQIRSAAAGGTNGMAVLVCDERYRAGAVAFDEYYTAHFLMVVGADGKNYLGTEVKYQPRYAIADVSRAAPGFLWEPSRLRRIGASGSGSFPSVGGRHRGVLYAHLVQLLKDGRETLDHAAAAAAGAALRHPAIL